MSEEVKNVQREPHPFIGVPHMMEYVGKTIAFVGKIEKIEDSKLILKTNDGKYDLPSPFFFEPLK